MIRKKQMIFASKEPSTNDSWNRTSQLVARATLLLLTFATVLFVCYLGSNFQNGMVPDHHYHKTILEYTRNMPGFFLTNTEPLYEFGAVSLQPPLYYRLLAIPLQVFPNLSQRHVAIFINLSLLAIGMATLFRTFRNAAENDERFPVICIWFILSFVMFPVLATLEQYDNLTNALGLSAFAALIAFLTKPSVRYLLLLIALCSLGVLTKLTFLPLALVIAFITIIKTFTCGKQIWMLESMRSKATVLLLFCAIATSSFASSFYARNLLAYGSVTPSCEKVLPISACEKNWAFSRERKATTEKKNTERLNPIWFSLRALKYVSKQWDDYIGGKYFHIGTKTWRIGLFTFLLCFMLLNSLRAGWRPIHDKIWLVSLAIACFYISFVFVYNFAWYTKSALFGTGLWFRYFFPVAGPFAYVVFAPFFTSKTSNFARWIAFLVFAIIFIRFPAHKYLLKRAPAELFISAKQLK